MIGIAARRPGFSCQGELGEFLDDYLVAESLLRRLISYYAEDKSRATSETIKTPQITAAFRHFDLVVEDTDVVGAFQGGAGKRGVKSARQLRNGFLHDLSPEDRGEIVANFTSLKASIARVISPILDASNGV